MKKSSILVLFSVALLACQKETAVSFPQPITAGFDQEFGLQYQQRATLPIAGIPELTITATELDYSFCPKGVQCFAPDFVAPTLSIGDALGHTQLLKMPSHTSRVYNRNWIDTTSVRANNRRYLFYFHRWEVLNNADNPTKKDISVLLRVTKPL